MRRVCIAAFALLGLAACRTEDKSDEVLGAERPRTTVEAPATVTMMPAPPAPPDSSAPASPPKRNAQDPIARPKPDPGPPPPWMRERAEDRALRDAAPRADDPARKAAPTTPPRPQDVKPDKAPESPSPLPRNTPPEKLPQQPPNLEPPNRYPPPSVPPEPTVPGEMPDPVPLRPRW